jgi:hypothetical protein
MKPGHKKKFKFVIQSAREEKQSARRDADLQMKLADIKREQILAQALGTGDHNADRNQENLKAANPPMSKVISVPVTVQETNKPKDSSGIKLPEGKRWHYFVSHKKSHSVHGSSSEILARGSKDLLEAVHGLRGFFDVSC